MEEFEGLSGNHLFEVLDTLIEVMGIKQIDNNKENLDLN